MLNDGSCADTKRWSSADAESVDSTNAESAMSRK